MSADGTIGPALAELRLRPDLQDLQSGILIRGMDGTLYWVSDDLLNKSVLNDGCLMPITDQPLRGEPLTEENRIRQVLQDRLDVLPPAVNVRNAIRGHLRVPVPSTTTPASPTQPRSGKVADDALSRLVLYIQRATGYPPPEET